MRALARDVLRAASPTPAPPANAMILAAATGIRI
jgi:hypothetical protein